MIDAIALIAIITKRLDSHLAHIDLYIGKIARDNRPAVVEALAPKIDEAYAAALELIVVLSEAGCKAEAEAAHARLAAALDA